LGKKEFGKPVNKISLPEAENLPIVHRFKEMGSEKTQVPAPEPEPTDAEYQQILQVESHIVIADPTAARHKLVTASAKSLRNGKPDNRGIVQTSWNDNALDIRVSKNSIDRALNIMNAIIMLLESEKFIVAVKSERHRATAQVFGHDVPFSIVEKTRQMGRKEVTRYSYTHTEMEYQPSGDLEFRAADEYYGDRTVRDGKTQKLENLISKCVGAILREARDRVISAEKRRLQEIEERKRAQERAALAEKIAEEEKKLKDLDSWVNSWSQAQKMRDFISVLAKMWEKQGHDLSLDSEKGQRIVWMNQQADRLDPLVESPESILDRKPELNRWY
jgi:hypothetical protein